MKFSSKRYPILADYQHQSLSLSKEFNQQLKAFGEPARSNSLKDVPNLTQAVYKNGCFYYLASTILERLETDVKLKSKLFCLLNEIKSETGVLLLPVNKKRQWISYLCYDFRNDGKECYYHFSIGSAKGIEGFIKGYYNNDKIDPLIITRREYLLNDLVNIYTNVSEMVCSIELLLFYTLLFKQYAEIETKIIQKGKEGVPRKIKSSGEQFCNETNVPIQILDSRWFTNIIRTNGFPVKGHLALRACGKGRKERTLTWISGYEKKGYNSTAKRMRKESTSNLHT